MDARRGSVVDHRFGAGPPFTIGPAEIDHAVGALEKALADVLARA